MFFFILSAILRVFNELCQENNLIKINNLTLNYFYHCHLHVHESSDLETSVLPPNDQAGFKFRSHSRDQAILFIMLSRGNTSISAPPFIQDH
jgi:hypothetical protein